MRPHIVYYDPGEQSQVVTREVPDLAGKRVVIVEDEGLTLLQIRRVLVSAGMTIVGTAINGAEGIEVVLRERPDLVMMDVRMPVLDGIQAAQKILDVYEVCIVMVTAFSDETYRRESDKIGACGYVVKPISGDTLLPELQALMAQFHRVN